jgi:hypothetical protein
MPAYRRQALDFRHEDVGYVMQRWKSGTSCALAGIGSIGKSNLLHHLANTEVHAHYFGDNAQQLLTVIVDANMLGSLPGDTDNEPLRCWAGYELMMHRLYLALYEFQGLSDDDAQQFYNLYQALQDGTNPLYAYMGLRYFELGIEIFMRRDIKVIFMFDEFEVMLQNLPTKFFQTLRGLRDSNKRNLLYLTFTRSPLETLVSHYNIPMLDIEPFIELFNDNLRYVGAYNEHDANAMLNDLSRRSGKAYPETLNKTLLHITGRSAGLLRASFHALEDVNANPAALSTDSLVERLILRAGVRAECKTIWASLNPSEQQVLMAAARIAPYSPNEETEQAVTMLVKKGLLRLASNPQQLIIEPILFHRFVQDVPSEAAQ